MPPRIRPWASAKVAFEHREPWWYGHHPLGNLSRVELNPDDADSQNKFDERYSVINPLVTAFSTIELLINSGYSPPANTVEAFNYITRWETRLSRKTIPAWDVGFVYVQRQAALAPLFKVWDDNTRKIDQAIEIAFEQATVLFEATNPAQKRLPDHVMEGIHVRIDVLQKWRFESLYPTRAGEDYQLWKKEQDFLKQQEQMSEIQSPPDGLMSLVGLRRRKPTPSRPHRHSPTAQDTQLRSLAPNSALKSHTITRYLQDDLMIWTFNIVIYISGAIIQSVSYNSRISHPSGDFLNSLQSTLTQLLSVYMVYILFHRESPTLALDPPHYAWFIVVSLLPVIALAICGARPGLSAILGFVGTAMAGFLQVLLATGLREGEKSGGSRKLGGEE